MRVLVVEDEMKMARLLERGLREEGYAVDVAVEGAEGVCLSRFSHRGDGMLTASAEWRERWSDGSLERWSWPVSWEDAPPNRRSGLGAPSPRRTPPRSRGDRRTRRRSIRPTSWPSSTTPTSR